MRVLVVDDQADLLAVVSRSFEAADHRVRTETRLADARTAMSTFVPDVIVLDVGLPDGNGIDFCRELRAAGARVPVLLLTAHGSIAERVAGLDAGADDFLPKPFALAELRARVRALARRGPITRRIVHNVDGVEFDFTARVARRRGTELAVTAREWSILELLSAREGRIVSRTEILEAVWGETTHSASDSLDVMVARIRRKLGTSIIRTLRGEGYGFGMEPNET